MNPTNPTSPSGSAHPPEDPPPPKVIVTATIVVGGLSSTHATTGASIRECLDAIERAHARGLYRTKVAEAGPPR
jgi:hypothetical protein